MLIFEAGIFASAMNDFAFLELTTSSPNDWLDEPTRRTFFAHRMDRLASELTQLGLKVSANKAELMTIHLRSNYSFKEEVPSKLLSQYCASLRESLQVELKGRKFYGPLQDTRNITIR